MTPACLAELRVRVTHYVKSLQSLTHPGFPISASSPHRTLLATCFAVFVYELLGALDQLPSDQRGEWQNWLQSVQDPRSGLFLDPLARPAEFAAEGHTWDYFTWQTTFFCLSALDALHVKPLHSLSFVEPYHAPLLVVGWLKGLNWRNPWLESNKIMFLVSFLLQMDMTKTANAVFDWLDHTQDAATGYWGTDRGADMLNAMAGAFHFYFLYFYLGRPVHCTETIIDHTLQLQQPDGLYHPRGGGGACLDLDAVDILVKSSLLTDYRAEDIRASLGRSFAAIVANQRPSGAFCEALRPSASKSLRRRAGEALGLDRLLRKPYRPPVEFLRYTGWSKMEYSSDEGDVWATWFRSLALALISSRYRDEFGQAIPWRFRCSPALGWHDPQRIRSMRQVPDL